MHYSSISIIVAPEGRLLDQPLSPFPVRERGKVADLLKSILVYLNMSINQVLSHYSYISIVAAPQGHLLDQPLSPSPVRERGKVANLLNLNTCKTGFALFGASSVVRRKISITRPA